MPTSSRSQSTLTNSEMGCGKKLALFCMVVMSLVMTSMTTLQDDEQDCAEQLTNLAGCIPYVSGSAEKPTPECCHDTQKLKESKPKCLCVLIKESTDPSMGLPINTTLALKMPSVCNIDAKVSNCPTLLNLPPNSADAKIFADAAGTDSTSPTTTTTPATDSPSTSSSTGSSSSTTTDSTSKSSDSKTTSTANDGSKTNSLGVGSMVVAVYAFLFI